MDASTLGGMRETAYDLIMACSSQDPAIAVSAGCSGMPALQRLYEDAGGRGLRAD